jgi:hypothetical protein
MTASHTLANARVSYEEWLRDKHGVIGKGENAGAGEYKTSAVVNYLFETTTNASNFLKNLNLIANIQQNVHIDILKNKPAVVIDEKAHKELQKEYKNYLQHNCTPRSESEIKNHLIEIEQRIIANNKSGATLDKLSALASDKNDDGWNITAATQAYRQSLLNYTALHKDAMSQSELNSLKILTTNHNKNDEGIIKNIGNDKKWWDGAQLENTNLWTQKKDEKTLLSSVEKQAALLLDGGKKDSSRFFPDHSGKSDVDSIYLNSGGMPGHFTVTKIWKRGFDQNDHPIAAGSSDELHHFKYYRTEYNAGAGAEHVDSNDDNSNVIWSTSTREISALAGDAPFHVRMHNSLQNVITAERMCLIYRNAEYDTGVPKEENMKWHHWNDKMEDSLEYDYLPDFSKKGLSQRSGNCALMSLKIMTDDIDSNLSEEHWRYAKNANKTTTLNALTDKKHELQMELKFVLQQNIQTKFANTSPQSSLASAQKPLSAPEENKTNTLTAAKNWFINREGMLARDKYGKIKSALEKLQCNVGANDRIKGCEITLKETNNKFCIQPNAITANHENVKTFILMLETFKTGHDDKKIPEIKTSSEAGKAMWIIACHEVYKNSANLSAIVKNIHAEPAHPVTKTQSNAPVTAEPEKNTRSAPRFR